VLSGALLAPIDIQPGTYRLQMLGTELALISGRTLCPCECQLPSGMTEPPSGQ